MIRILMPVYNAESTLEAAIGSIVAQTWHDFELIVVDDGSRDDSLSMAEKHAATDRRVRVITQANAGVGRTLNRALDLAYAEPDTDFIARMDADDISLPHRLATQMQYLREHPDVDVVGSWDKNFGGSDELVRKFPTDPDHLAAVMLFRNPISHPTVLWRADALRDFRYDLNHRYTEDYDLWARVAVEHRIANIPEALMLHRVSESSVCAVFHEPQVNEAAALQLRLVKSMGLDPTSRQAAIHKQLAFDALVASPLFLAEAFDWLAALAAANDVTARFGKEGLMRALTGRFVVLAGLAAACAPEVYRRMRESVFMKYVTAPLPELRVA